MGEPAIIRPFGGEQGGAVITDSSNRILVTGVVANKPALLRFSSTGVLDTSFGDNGVKFLSSNSALFSGIDHKQGIAIDTGGRIIVTGGVYNPSSGSNDPGIWSVLNN